MENREIFSKIESLDSKKQEVLFLTQKYKDFKFSKEFLLQFDGIDESQFQEEDNKVDVFQLFQLVGQDEKRFREILRKLYFDENTFDVKGEKLSLENLQERGHKKKIESVGREFAAYFDLILHDVLRYFELKSGISKEEKETVNLEGEEIEVGKLSRFYSQQIMTTLINKKREEKYKGDFDYNTQLTDEDIQALGLDMKDTKEKPKEIQDLAWKYDFFKLVQKSVEKGYILTHREYELIKDVLSDLQDGEVVLFTGDTGSGKTELARFICEEYMGNGYVFVSGSKDLEVSDFTVDKNVTSKAPIETEPNVVTGEESVIKRKGKGEEQEEAAEEEEIQTKQQEEAKESQIEENVKQICKQFVNSKNFEDMVQKYSEQEGKSEKEVKEIKEKLHNPNLRGSKGFFSSFFNPEKLENVLDFAELEGGNKEEIQEIKKELESDIFIDKFLKILEEEWKKKGQQIESPKRSETSNSEESRQAEELFDNVLAEQRVKDKVVEKARENGKSEEDIKQLKQELDDENLREKKLITEYHYMGLYKAANAGVPCIIDEVNLIRPEIFMALNDVLTKQTGDEIQLPNALKPIEVKDGFCIILTGNDPEQNSDVKRYTAGRYNFDEATYNRLKVYAKNYLNQTVEEKKEKKIQEDLEEMQNYLDDNELFGVMLMMMFQTNKNMNASGKYGYEIMKRDFDGKNIGKQEFFETIKRFAYSVSKIQKAFAGEVISLSGEDAGMSVKDNIKRKVFSMRDLVNVLSSYKDDALPLDFHIYDEFIEHTTNEDEQYAILKIFNEHGFFGNLVTDDKKSAIKNVNRKMQELKGKRKELEPDDIENKVVITKQDLYTQYFGSMGLDDDFFEKQKEEIQSEEEEEEKLGESDDEVDIVDNSQIEVEAEDLLETINLVKNTFSESIDRFGVKDNAVIIEVGNILNILEEEINKDNLEKSLYSKINSLLIKLNNQFDQSDVEGVKESINELKTSLQ